MLICPQCKFENPHANKFCQNCGTSLTHKVCPQCSTEVPVNALSCHNCGAECGKVWWAIIAQVGNGEWGLVAGKQGEDQAGKTENQAAPLSPEPSLPSLYHPPLTVGSYLDKEQRYQLLEPLPNLELKAANTSSEVCVRVLDCQPYQISPIEAMLASQQQGLTKLSGVKNIIPSLAIAYILLESSSHPGIPQIHDAWQQGNTQVILIEDRSAWQSLLDLWQAETTSYLQVLHWCYQMTKLWAVLEPVNCCYSLLKLSNLRLDEDQTLVLQRLYEEPLNSDFAIEWLTDQQEATSVILEPPLTIKALGRVWQALFKQSQRTQLGSVVQVLGDLEQGKIETIAQLRSRLEEIATELETPTTANDYPMEEEKFTVAPTLLQVDEPEDTLDTTDDLPTVVLSMQLSSLEDAGQTDVGRQRDHNEDYFGIETKIEKLELPKNRVLQARGLYILCDGMGGHAGGEIASELAVSTLRQYFEKNWIADQLPTEDSIREAVYLANGAIYQLNQQDARSGVGRMGTTLVMLLIQDTKAAVAHVGDSRLYRLTRKRGLEQITVDHEVGQREIARGVEASIAYTRPDAYQLTQALGPRDDNWLYPDVEFFDINEDSLLILASDGLSDNDFLENHWQPHLLPLLSSGANLERGVTQLIDLANQHNGHDNITAILIRAKVRPSMPNSEG